MIRFDVPGRPRGKQRVAQSGPHGHRFAAPASAAEERGIAFLCRQAMGARRPMLGPIKLTIWAVFRLPKDPKRRAEIERDGGWHTSKPDGDNIAKLVKDALNQVAWGDDAQIAITIVAKRYGQPERVEIKIEPAPPQGG